MSRAERLRVLRQFRFCFNPDHHALPDYEAVVDALERVLGEFDYWTSEPRPAVDGGTVRIHYFGEVQPAMERRFAEARIALRRLRESVPA